MKKTLHFIIILISALGFSQETWDYLPIEISNNYHGAICPINENVVHVVSDNGVFYKTVDGGETWTQFESGLNEYFFDLAFDGVLNGYAVGAAGTILKTSNAGETWLQVNSETTEALFSVAINAPNNIWAVGDNGTLIHSTDGGNSWVWENSLTTERLNSIKFKDENIGYIAGSNGVLLYTANGGVNWEQLSIPTTEDVFSISITENHLYLMKGVVDYGYEYHSVGNELLKTNNNINWTNLNIHDIFEGDFGNADLYFRNDGTGFAMNSVALLCDCCNVWIVKTMDGGENWDYSLNEETNSANCHANQGYADIKFATEDVGYALLGRFILKTPYESAGVEDFNLRNSFTVYPNPTTDGKFNLKINSLSTAGLSVEMVDINGKKIFAKSDLEEMNTFSFTNISNGIYFVKLLKNGKMVAAKKLLKQ